MMSISAPYCKKTLLASCPVVRIRSKPDGTCALTCGAPEDHELGVASLGCLEQQGFLLAVQDGLLSRPHVGCADND